MKSSDKEELVLNAIPHRGLNRAGLREATGLTESQVASIIPLLLADGRVVASGESKQRIYKRVAS